MRRKLYFGYCQLRTNPMASGEYSPEILSYEAPAFTPDRVGYWRSGDCLEVSRDAVLPDRCVKCNRPASGSPIRFEVDWVDPLLKKKYRHWHIVPFVNAATAIALGVEINRHRKSAV